MQPGEYLIVAGPARAAAARPLCPPARGPVFCEFVVCVSVPVVGALGHRAWGGVPTVRRALSLLSDTKKAYDRAHLHP